MIKRFFKVIFAGTVSIFTLSLFCFFYMNDGINISNPAGATDYTCMPDSLKATMNEGFCFFRMDAHGFNNETVKEDVDVLLMGSSHVESAHMQSRYSINALMNERLSDQFVYNIGMSGHTIYRCADNLSAAIEVYRPKDAVIIEMSDVDLDEKQMRSVLDGTALPIKTHDTGALFYLQKIRALKVIFNQLMLWRDADLHTDPAALAPADKSKTDDAVLNAFLAKMRSDTPSDLSLIIFYHPTAKVDPDGRYNYDRMREKRDAFSRLCEKNGIVFADMTDAFQNEYENYSAMAHGFINTAVEKGHLNKTGNRIIANELVLLLRGRDKNEP